MTALGTTPVRRLPAPEQDRPGPVVLLAFLLAAIVLGLMARTTVIPGTELAAIWPSAGVAVLWLLVRRAAPVSIDTALLFGTMLVFGLTLDIPAWLAPTLAALHTLQTVVIVVLMRRFLPDLWGCGGDRVIDSPRVLATYFGCVASGVLLSGALISVVWSLMNDEDAVLDVLLWLGRNTCGILLVTTSGLMLLPYLAQPRPRPRPWTGNGHEFLAACLTSVALYLVVFVADVQALLFLILGVVIWCGVRFGTLTNVLHMLVLGYLAISSTLHGFGPFTDDQPLVNALLVQVFVIGTAATGLALSTGIEERNQLHREVQETSDAMTYQAQLLQAVVSSMAEGLAVVDDAGHWLMRNPAAARVGGLPGDLRAVLKAAPDGLDPLDRALAGETVHDLEIRVSEPPGAGRILAVSAAPLPRDSVTGRARAVIVFRDATVEHARRVDLTAFAEVVAHDLRNPLAAVESWTGMMRLELGDGTVDRDLVHQYVDRVGTGTRRMKELIEDLLGRATEDSTLRLRHVDVAELAEEVAAEHGAAELVTVGEIPAVHADPVLVRQLLDNLVGNALKFVRPGERPRVRITGRRTGHGTVSVAVADEGVGLPAGTNELVFDQHHRAHPTYDGRGLGLAICRRIVERHGGTITARNGARGAVFEFTLPASE